MAARPREHTLSVRRSREILRGGCCTPRPNLRHLPQVAPVAAEGSGEPSTGQVSG